jgi:hypothetical protein
MLAAAKHGGGNLTLNAFCLAPDFASRDDDLLLERRRGVEGDIAMAELSTSALSPTHLSTIESAPHGRIVGKPEVSTVISGLPVIRPELRQ